MFLLPTYIYYFSPDLYFFKKRHLDCVATIINYIQVLIILVVIANNGIYIYI